ncbi:MAG: DNA adenine methylase [Gemmatimonadetes bacterium]|nr:DNA adenine methylase [Gemmatimonadota bacterium]
MIKYIGSKRTLVARIVELADAVRANAGTGSGAGGAWTACDLFCGTTRVSQGLKAAGFVVTANDLATYSEVFATTYIEADAKRVRKKALAEKLAALNALPGYDGYFTKTFCEESRFFQPFNGRRMDAIRDAIDDVADGRIERAILLTSLMEAADRVDSTTGLQMAYLKAWAPRSHNALELRMPALIAGRGRAVRSDANVLAAEMDEVDIAYLDPPYNQHSYHSNYHIWETLVRHDAPPAYGVARKREDCRTIKSPFNSKVKAWEAFSSLVRTVPAKHLIVSFSDEGFFSYDEIVSLLADVRGDVAAVPVSHKRYVGAQIGIYNPKGEKVGKVGHLTNSEFLFVAGAGAGRVLQGMKVA